MKTFIAFSTLLALAVARPSIILSQPRAEFIATAPLVSQYHSQDSIGQYSYGYNGGLSAKNEVRSWDGITRGSYSYVDSKGELQSVAYTADAVNGFRAAATNLPEAPKDMGVAPEPVKDTPEVAKARAEHLAIVEMGGVAPLPAERAALPELPEPVKETEEVAKARADHMMALEKAKMSGPEDIKLEPVKETPEVAMARSEHLKAHEVAKTRNAIVEAIDNQPIQVVSPHFINGPAPLLRYSLAEPTITKLVEPTVRLASPALQEVKLEAPVIASHIEPNLRFATIPTLAAPSLEIKPLKLEGPAVTKLEKLETPVLRVAAAAPAPLTLASPYTTLGYNYNYNNYISPLSYAYEPARLIRSV